MMLSKERKRTRTLRNGSIWMMAAAMLLSIAFIFAGCPFAASAEQAELETYSFISTEEWEVNEDAGMDAREAAAGYIQQIMVGQKSSGSTARRARRVTAGSRLTGREKRLYDALEPLIAEVAAGQRASAVFSIPAKDVLDDAYCTAEELGVKEITQENMQEVMQTFLAQHGIDVQKVNDALMADHPYEMYWFDKTKSGMVQYPLLYNPQEVLFSDEANATMTVTYIVSADYAADGKTGGSTIDTSYGQRAEQAAETARAIIAENAGKGDLAKLTAYKEKICALVDYNEDAAEHAASVNYGNPWQLVWVFDGDPATKVVCEGYSKAFQFLCDESALSYASCISVSGGMGNGSFGAHMWNIVTMNDGKKYMADITNSDQGAIGENGGLFLDGYDKITKDGSTVYWYKVEDDFVGYIFNDEMADLYGEEALDLASEAYDPDKVYADYIVEDGVLTAYTGKEPDFQIPEELTITAIGDGVICDQDWLRSVTLPEGITAIGEGAFARNPNLTSVQLPDSLKNIGKNAFSGNKSLTKVEIPIGVSAIGEGAFGDSDGLVLVYDCDSYAAEWNQTEKIQSIVRHEWGEPQYTWSEDQETVTAERVCARIASHVESETAEVTRAITSPTETEAGLLEREASFENTAFEPQRREQSIKALKDSMVLRVPANTTVIEAEAFRGAAIEAVLLPESCREVQSGAFADCAHLEYVYIPASCSVAEDAFAGSPEVILDR